MAIPSKPYEEAYQEVFAVVGPHSEEMHRWRRKGQRALWAYVAVGIADGLVVPWIRLGWAVTMVVVVILTGLLVYQRYCEKQATKADKIMMAKFHEAFRAQLDKYE